MQLVRNMDRKTMMQFYKVRSVTFGVTGIEKRRKEDNEKLRLERRDRRTQMFNVGRSILVDETNANVSDNTSKENDSNLSGQNNMLLDRKIALQKYKHEKQVIKQSLKQKKKPPFVVGIPHHGNSPVLKEINAKVNKNCSKQIESKTQAGNQRLTRANFKLAQGSEVFVPKSPVRMFPFNERKTMFSFQLNKGAGLKKLTSPHTPTVLKRSAQKSVQGIKEKASSNMKREQLNHKSVVKVLKNVLRIKNKSSTTSSDSDQSLAAPLPNPNALDDISEHNIQESEPVTQFDFKPSSPPMVCEAVVLENHNVSDKLETKKLEESISEEKQESPGIDSRKSFKKEESDTDIEVTFQRGRVDNESLRLLSLVEEWEGTSQDELIPQDVIDEIDSVVGQTRLLTRDKFNQFRGLIDEYQTQKGSKQITVDDLNGFWDMVYLQVESLNKKFSHLEILKVNNWEEPKIDIPHKKTRRGQPKRKPKKPDSAVRENIDLDVDPLLSISRESVACTPRRSLRLTGKTPTQLSPKCITCKTSGCDSSYCAKPSEKKNTSRRSSRVDKNMTSLIGSELENTSKGSSLLEYDNVTRRSRRGQKNILFKQEQENLPVESHTTANKSGESVSCTPRKSLRLAGKTPTQLSPNHFTCKTPDSGSSYCAKQSKKENTPRRSSRVNENIASLIGSELEKLSKESSPFGNVQPENSNEAKRINKGFILRPSKLIWNDTTNKSPNDSTNKSPIPKARNPLCIKDENSQLNNSNLDSCLVRRSMRFPSAKKVRFDKSLGEQPNFRFPATPYSRKGSIRKSISDSFSE